MCGITGIISTTETVNLNELIASGKKLLHRGPDDSGTYLSDNKRVGMAHQRLSLIDLSANGKQPLSEANGHITVAFNGEIYNYAALRERLVAKGYSFKTKTDTEVLLHGYSEWGLRLPEMLEGMFAISIYDSQEQKLLLIRDRFGIKPLYYGAFSGTFVFASEIKALFEYTHVNKVLLKESVSLFLANRYVPAPLTMWEGIYKLKPAMLLEIDAQTLKTVEHVYWKLTLSENHAEANDFKTKVEELITDSIHQHQVADVEIGTFLSGGMDSTLVLGLMKTKTNKPKAFTIGFESWDKSEHLQAKVAATEVNAELQTCVLKEESFHDLEQIMYYFDDPIADISIIPTYFLSQLASKKVKAVLSGEGADELFAGYHWHKPQGFYHKNFLSKLKSFFFKTSFKQIKAHYTQAMSMGLFDKEELKKAFHPGWQTSILSDPFKHFDQFKLEKNSTLKQIQYLDLQCFMPELVLHKIDGASMAHSLEVRVPFLNHRLFDYIFSLKTSVYFKDGEQKFPLQEILKKTVNTLGYKKIKQGLVGPDSYYMNYESYARELLNGILVSDFIINKSYIQSLVQSKDHWRLWKLLVLEKWWKINKPEVYA